MKRILNNLLAGLVCSGLCLAPAVSFAQDRGSQDQRSQDQRSQDQRSVNQSNQAQRYHDARHNDDHEWNDHEQSAYRIWLKSHHGKDEDFSRLSPRDQQNYWNWRHSHSDAQLHINIR